jgi:serine/threonine protein kinase
MHTHTDWGFAQVLQSGARLQRQLGTGSYMAPEILSAQPYTEKADMWSAGVIFFVLLCGFPPYEAQYFAGRRGEGRS